MQENSFFALWGEAARTSLGFFWMALWAFALGYVISSMIQVFVTRERMKRSMGEAGAKSVGLATVFGFISPLRQHPRFQEILQMLQEPR